MVGLPDLKLLDSGRLAQPLGPGYTPPPIPKLHGRTENCDLSTDNSGWLRRMKKSHEKFIRDMSDHAVSFESLGENINGYHGSGHMKIARVCSTQEGAMGVMAAAGGSARDPIFYQWHSHIEDLMQQYRDKRYLPYEVKDFPLSNGLQVLEVKTIIDKEELKTENHVENMLVTFDEIGNVKLTHHREYKRINHHNFKYHIKVANPQKISRKVMVRIWLGWMGKQNLMVEMDRFVTELKSKEVEIIERKSIQSSATMKIQTTEEMYVSIHVY